MIKVHIDKQMQGYALYYAEGHFIGLSVLDETNLKKAVYRQSITEIKKYAAEHNLEVV